MSASEYLLRALTSQAAQLAKQIYSKVERMSTLTQHEKSELLKLILTLRAYQKVLSQGTQDPLLEAALSAERRPAADRGELEGMLLAQSDLELLELTLNK